MADEEPHWTLLRIAQWSGEGPRAVELCTDTAVWYHAGKPPVLIRWVLIRDPRESFEPQAWLSTTQDQTPEQMVTWFLRRWTIEVTLAEARAHLGMETPRQWHERAMARTTPALLSRYSMITLTAHR